MVLANCLRHSSKHWGAGFDVRVMRYPDDASLGYQALEVAVRSLLPSTQPFVLLGESFSGPIAIAIAARPPPNLVGAVLCCTFVSNPQPRLSPFQWLLRFVSHRSVPIAFSSRVLLGRYSDPALHSALSRALATLSPRVLRARLREVVQVDVTNQLATITLPVLCLQARNDHLVPASAAAKLSRANSRVQIETIDGPHFLLQSCPAQAAAIVRRFLSTIS